MKVRTILVALLAVVVLSAPAYSQMNIGFNGIGPFVGIVGPNYGYSGGGMTLGFGARADLGTVTPKIGLMADFLYWGKSWDESSYEWTWKYSFSSIYISVLGRYFLGNPDAKIKPYAAGGVSLVISSDKFETNETWYGYDPNWSHSYTDVGFVGEAGVTTMLSPQIEAFAMARYLTGAWGTWGIFVGGVYKLK